MSTSKNKMLVSIENYLNAVNDKIKNISLDDLKDSFKPLVFEKNITLNSDAVRQYDLKTLMDDHHKYQLASAEIKVLVKDVDSSSKTYNSFVNSEEVITSSIDLDGLIKIHNTSNDSRICVIKIMPPLETKNLLVYEAPLTLAADTVKQYNLKTLFPLWSEYQLMSADIKVLVKNKDNTSKTYNLFINSEAVITVANDDNGAVKIHNTSSESQTLVVKITPPLEKI